MVTITNKSNKPVGVIGGQFCLPDQKIVLKDKEALCDVYDEEGVATGEKQVLPGLKAMECRGYITIEVKEDEPKKAAKVEKAEEPVEVAEEVAAEEPKKTTRKRTTKKTTE